VGPTAPNPAGGQTSVLGELVKGITKQSIYDPERAKGPEDIPASLPPGLGRSLLASFGEGPEWAGGSTFPEELVKPSEMEHLRQPMGPPKPKPPQGGPSMSLAPPEQLFPEQVEPPTATQEIEGPPSWIGGKAERNTGTVPTMTDEAQMVEFLKSRGATEEPIFSEMPPGQARDLKQRAVLEQGFGSPGMKTLSPRESKMAKKSPFDSSRDEDAYFSPESLERRLKDERRYSIDDQFLAAGAGMLGGDDLLGGLGAALEGARGPRERYQKLEHDLPLQYSQERYSRSRQNLEDQRLADQLGIDVEELQILKNQDARTQEVHEDEGPVRDRNARISQLGGELDQLTTNLLSNDTQTRAESAQRVKQIAMEMQLDAQKTQSSINVDKAQIGSLEAQAQGTGAWAPDNNSYGSTRPSILSYQNAIQERIENSEFPSIQFPGGMALWEAGGLVGGMDARTADEVMPYSYDAAKLRRMLENNVPIDQVIRDYGEDVKGTPLEQMLLYYKERSDAALGASR
jgi:hypothetical protein